MGWIGGTAIDRAIVFLGGCATGSLSGPLRPQASTKETGKQEQYQESIGESLKALRARPTRNGNRFDLHALIPPLRAPGGSVGRARQASRYFGRYNVLARGSKRKRVRVPRL